MKTSYLFVIAFIGCFFGFGSYLIFSLFNPTIYYFNWFGAMFEGNLLTLGFYILLSCYDKLYKKEKNGGKRR
jgi:ABC-type multidrug transport system permease subunit